jgi:hypothetical protein
VYRTHLKPDDGGGALFFAFVLAFAFAFVLAVAVAVAVAVAAPPFFGATGGRVAVVVARARAGSKDPNVSIRPPRTRTVFFAPPLFASPALYWCMIICVEFAGAGGGRRRAGFGFGFGFACCFIFG